MFFFKFKFVFMCVVLHATFGQSSGNFFKTGQRYTYVYRGEAMSHHDTLPARQAVLRFQCYLHIDLQDLSEGRLQMDGCQLRDDSTNLHKRSDEFAAAVQRYSMYFQLQNETFINKLIIDYDEPADIANFKRGAISSILFKQRLAPVEQAGIRQVLVQGACQTWYVADDTGGQLERLVNLSSCDTPISNNSTSKCIYSISHVASEPRLTSIECDDTYFVEQLDFLGSLGKSSTTTAKLRQTYDLLQVTPTASTFDFRHLASSKRVTTLAYEPTRENASPIKLRHAFKNITDEQDISAMPTAKAVALFEEFADVLKRFDHNTLWRFLQDSWDCAHCIPKQKSLRQSRLLDGLMSCGTASCDETYARAAVEAYISGAKVKLFLLDAALKKKTSLPIIQAVFRLCKKNNGRGCWLNLGSLIHTCYEKRDPGTIQVSSEILVIVAYLRRIIGASCEPFIDNFTNRIIKHYDIVLTLKTFGNIGNIIRIADRGLPMNEQVLPTLLKCARNTNVSHNVAMEAIQALRRMTLDDDLTSQLLGLLRSQIHPMIRIATYKILMREPSIDTLKQIVRLVQTERSEHFQSYVVSHLNNILESEDPAMTSVQSTLLKCLAEDEMSLPKPPKTLVTLSHHKSLYKAFSVPNLGQPIGVKIDVDVIYDPSSRIPGSIRLNLTLNAFERSLNLLDCGLSMQYMEDILRKLLGKDAEVLLQFLGIPSFEKQYQQTMSRTQFHNIKRTILDNIQQLDDSVTMSGVPDLIGDLRILGHEIVFGNLHDLKPLLGYFENLKHLSLKDLLGLFLEHDLRKEVNHNQAIGLTREKTTLPTILGIPLTVTSSSHALISLHPRLSTQRHERSKSLDFALAAGGFFNLKTELAVSIPGFVEVATSWSGHVNGSVDLDMKAKVEFSTSGVKLTFSNPFEKIKTDVFTVSTRQTLSIDDMEQEVTSPQQQPIKNRCSSTSFYQISGIRICVGVRLPHRHHRWLPFLPLSGPFTLNIGLESAQRSPRYTTNFEFLQQYRRGQPGKSAGSSFSSMKVTLEGSNELSASMGRSQTTISVQAKGELLKYRSVDDKPAYKLDFSISNGEKILFDIKYYKTMHEKPLQSPVPSVFIRFPATVSINVSTPFAYLAMVGATLHRTPRDFFTQLNVTYFCADQTSFFYRLHIQPQRAYHPGDVTELFNKITVKGDRVNGTGWTEVTYLLKYPGQEFEVSTSTNFHPRSSVTDAEVNWLANDGTKRTVKAKSDLSTKKKKKGVQIKHVLTGSSDDWNGEASWSLIRGRRGQTVGVDFSFDVHNTGTDVRRTKRSANDVFFSFVQLNKQTSPTESIAQRGVNMLREIKHSLKQRIDSAVHGIGHLVGETGTRLSLIRNNVQQILGRVVSDVRQRGHVEIPRDLETEYGVRQRIRERKQYANNFKQAVEQTLHGDTLFEPRRNAVDNVFRGKEPVEMLQGFGAGKSSNKQWYQWSQEPLATNRNDLSTNAVNISFRCRFRNVTLTTTALHPNVPLDYKWDIAFNYPYLGAQQHFKTSGRYINDTKIHKAQNSQALHMNLSSSQLCSDMTFDLDLHHRKTSLEIMCNLTNSQPGRQHGFKQYQYMNINKKPLTVKYISFLNSSLVKGSIEVKANVTKGKGLQYGVYGDVSSPIEFLNFNIRDVGSLSSDVWKKSALTYHPYFTTNRTLFLNRTYELLTFDVLNLRGFDSSLKLSKVWTPQASHTTVTLPDHDVALHYLVDKTDPSNRNMTFYHESLSKEQPYPDISWQMALDQSHRVVSNLTVTPSGQRGLKAVLHHIKHVALVWVKSAWTSLDHNFLPKEDRDKNCSLDGLSLMDHLLFLETRICLYLGKKSTSCNFRPPSPLMELLSPILERAKTKLYQAITRKNIPRRIGPDRPGELRDKQFYSSVRLPFEWNDFDALPTLTHEQKALLKRLKAMIKKLKNKEVVSRQTEPRYQTALIFGAGYVQTFDGFLYEHPGYRSNKCVYLLARDFDGSVFSILSTVDAVTLLLPNLAISIDGENRVAVNMTDKFIELPFSSRDGNVMVKADGPFVNVHTNYGIDLTCDSVNFQCLFNISEVHHNHTLGLLGTNDGEQLNDMRTPTGRLAAGIADFVDAYEVSGKAECLYDYGSTSSCVDSPTGTCANDTSAMCKNLFQEGRSSLSDCFGVVMPLSYMDFCVENTRNSDVFAPSSTLCSLATAYVTACRFRGVNIKYLESCTSCNGRPAGAIWQQTIQKTADIVFIISLHANVSMQHDFNHRLQHLAHHIEHALVGREGYSHLRYGLVGFAGAGMRGPDSFTINGHLFGPYQEFHRVLRSMLYTGQKTTDGLDAVRLAASYPFRPEASRVVILVTGRERQPTRPREPLVDVLHELQRNSIRMYTVSRYPDLTRRASVIGITWGSQLVTTNRKTSVVVSDFPKGDYAKLSKTTQGAVFSLHRLIQSPISSRLYSHLSDNIRQQVSGEVTTCRKCECLLGRAGEGVASCKSGIGEC